MTAPLILSVFPTFAVGGAQSRFATIANHFGDRWRHLIVAMDGVTTARERLSPGLSVAFPAVEIVRGDTLGNVRRFRAALLAWRPDTMLTHNFGSVEWAIANRLAVTRHVHVEDGFGPEERERQIARRVWLRRVFLRGRPIALPSRTLVRIAREQWRMPMGHVHYVPNGIDLDRFAPAAAGERSGGLVVGPVVVGTVAALRPEKNIGRLIRAFAAASAGLDARLSIVGDGAERAGLAALVQSLGLGARVSFAGHVADPAALIRGFDVFALSSDTEQMPISLLEAMAAGCAVAATDVGDVAAMLGEGQRAHVSERTDAGLAAALGALLRDGALRHALGAANRRKVEAEFRQEQMLAAWRGLLESGRPGQLPS